MNNRTFRILLFFVLGISVLVILAGLLYFFGGVSLLAGPGPSVRIVQPAGDLAIRSGETIVILVQAHSEDGVARIDLLMDGEVIRSHSPKDPARTSFITPFNWFSSRVGEQHFEVIAYDGSGNASEPASLTVAVHPRVAAQRNGLPDNLAPNSDFEPIAQNLPNAAEAAGGGEASGDEGGGDPQNGGGQQGGAAEPQPLVEAVPEVADDAPYIDFFDYDLDFTGGGFEASLMAIAGDDLGIDHLEFVIASDGGPLERLTHDCAGQAACEVGIGPVPLAPGEWLFSVQAFDTSGQASEPELLIAEVLGEVGEPPAAAEHDQEWADWFREQFGDIANPQFDFNWDFDRPNFDVADFLGGFGDPQEEVVASGNCIEVSVAQAADYNRISFEVVCEIMEAHEGLILYPHVSKRLEFQDDGGISLHIPDWYDEHRTSFEIGETLSWEDHDIVCGMAYRYAVRIDLGVVREAGRNSASAVGIAGGAAYEEFVVLPLNDCPAGSPGDVNLQAQLDGQNRMQISWAFPVDAQWPQDPPLDNGLSIRLLRYSPFFDEQIVLFEEVLTLDQINAQPAFNVSDADLQCNTNYWYTLEVIAADADLNLVSPGWIVRQPVDAPVVVCDVSRLDDWFDVSTYWHNDRYHYALVEVGVPEGAQFPAGDNVEVWLEFTTEGGGCGSPPCDGNYKVFDSRTVRGGRISPAVYEDFFELNCGVGDYLIRMAIAVDRVGVEYANTVRVSSEKCPPPAPRIASAFATTNDCPANVERCVWVEWELYQQPLDTERYNPAVQIYVQRVNFNLNNISDFPVGFDSTSFVDTMPLYINENALPAFQCEAPAMYRMWAVDENGRFYGYTVLSLNNLTCEGEWDQLREAR